MAKITVICREENDYRDNILIYVVDVKDPQGAEQNAEIVRAAVEKERKRDLGEDIPMEILFAFAGDVPTLADWRE